MNLRNGTERIVQLAWLITFGAWIFAMFHAGDRDPLQWPSALFATFALLSALTLTVLYRAVVVPLVTTRLSSSRRQISENRESAPGDPAKQDPTSGGTRSKRSDSTT